MPDALQKHTVHAEELQALQIRRATMGDAAAIASLLYRSFLEYEASYTREAFAATVCTPEIILARIIEGPVWVGLVNGALVGTVSAVVKAEGLYVRGMAVDPGARGGRIGRGLLSCVEDYAVESGCELLFLSTTPFLLPAIRLYERWGFCRTQDGPHDLKGTPLFTMVKKLSRPGQRASRQKDFSLTDRRFENSEAG
jgi:GNAT superfamily N-acetyltransferase